MVPDTDSDFGRYAPSTFLRSLISFAQNCPHNWLGQQLAQVVRKLVLSAGTLPIDVTVGPIRMRCYLRDNNSEKKFVFMPWRFDQRERQLLLETLPANGVFVDIGANVGIYTLVVATHLSSQGRILALEPNPPAFERLCFNLRATRSGRSEWPAIDALQVAVADDTRELCLHLDRGNLGGSSLAAHGAAVASRDSTAEAEVVRVSCRPLLALLEERSIPRVDAMKIDIEGAEDLALVPYLREATDDKLPKTMVVENSEHLWKLDLVGALADRGYAIQMRSRMNTVYRRDGGRVRA